MLRSGPQHRCGPLDRDRSRRRGIDTRRWADSRPAAATATDIQSQRERRRCRRDGHGRPGKFRHRSRGRRLRGVRRRQAAEDRDLLATSSFQSSSGRIDSAWRAARCPPTCGRTATAESGRVYIILLDDLNVAPLRTGIVRKHARDFIERHLGPNDLAAVVVTSGRKDAAQEFTSDPALLLEGCRSFHRPAPAVGRKPAHRRLLSVARAVGPRYAREHRQGSAGRGGRAESPHAHAVVRSRRIRNAASAPSACSTRFAASRNISRACGAAARRCSGSAKASTTR